MYVVHMLNNFIANQFVEVAVLKTAAYSLLMYVGLPSQHKVGAQELIFPPNSDPKKGTVLSGGQPSIKPKRPLLNPSRSTTNGSYG